MQFGLSSRRAAQVPRALPQGSLITEAYGGPRAIKARWPAARVVMLTALTDDETVLESIQAGADGYLTKDRAIDEVVSAVRAAYAGETLLPRSVIVSIAQRVAAARERGTERRQIEPLTPRELEVLKALTEGLATPEICERLYIAPNTLRTHVQNIMGKLRVHSKFAHDVLDVRPQSVRSDVEALADFRRGKAFGQSLEYFELARSEGLDLAPLDATVPGGGDPLGDAYD